MRSFGNASTKLSLGTVLKENGYEIIPHVGVAVFFIDLGVKHPAKAGAFLLGIECDGASYRSGRSARDRDRLRREILENLGWKIPAPIARIAPLDFVPCRRYSCWTSIFSI